MKRIFYYRDKDIFCHHTLDEIPNPEDYTTHAHEMPEILYFISGRGICLVEGHEYVLRPHDMILVRSAEVHKLQIRPDEPYERLVLHFSPSVFSSIDPEGRLMLPFNDHPLGQRNCYHESDYNLQRLVSSMESIDSLDAHSGETRLHLLSVLLLLLAELSDAYQRQSENSEPVGTGGLPSELVDYVNRNLFGNLSLASVSSEFYISESQANRIFRKATGLTVWKFILIKRLLTARARILDGEPAGKVCTDCGFHDYSSFFRAYKQRFGSTPKQDEAFPGRQKNTAGES